MMANRNKRKFTQSNCSDQTTCHWQLPQQLLQYYCHLHGANGIQATAARELAVSHSCCGG